MKSLLTLALAIAGGSALLAAPDGGLLVGWASADITPDRPVAVGGQMHTRVSKYVHDPVTATVLALEGKRVDGQPDQAIMVSIDAPGRDGILEGLRDRLRLRMPGFDLAKLFVNATHTHTAPETDPDLYAVPKDIMQPLEYLDFMLGRISDAVARAWRDRKPGAVAWGLSYATVGHNRRAVYSGGRAAMYGDTNRPDFVALEAAEDPAVKLLFLFDEAKNLTGVVVNVNCPSQVNEGEYYVSADFWHEVREELRKRHSKDLFVYAMAGAAGDQSPHFLYRSKAEQKMRERRGLSETREIGRRIANAVDDAFAVSQGQAQRDAVLSHRTDRLALPARIVTDDEAAAAKADYEKALADPKDPNRSFAIYFKKQVLERFERQKTDPYYPAEVHTIRLGDVAITTNPFELFLDFGVRMEARSRADLTFVVELAGDYGGYLPTRRAVEGGSYSVTVESNRVGPKGGDVLVERAVEFINSFWPEAPKNHTELHRRMQAHRHG